MVGGLGWVGGWVGGWACWWGWLLAALGGTRQREPPAPLALPGLTNFLPRAPNRCRPGHAGPGQDAAGWRRRGGGGGGAQCDSGSRWQRWVLPARPALLCPALLPVTPLCAPACRVPRPARSAPPSWRPTCTSSAASLRRQVGRARVLQGCPAVGLHGGCCPQRTHARVPTRIQLPTAPLPRAPPRAPGADADRPRPSLVVCPSTLVAHWPYEVAKFVGPEALRALAYHGAPGERAALRARLPQVDLLVMSYEALRAGGRAGRVCVGVGWRRGLACAHGRCQACGAGVAGACEPPEGGPASRPAPRHRATSPPWHRSPALPLLRPPPPQTLTGWRGRPGATACWTRGTPSATPAAAWRRPPSARGWRRSTACCCRVGGWVGGWETAGGAGGAGACLCERRSLPWQQLATSNAASERPSHSPAPTDPPSPPPLLRGPAGTPVQNAVHELWALFDFLMPGLLGSQRQFNARYGRTLQAGCEGGRRRTALQRLPGGRLVCSGEHQRGERGIGTGNMCCPLPTVQPAGCAQERAWQRGGGGRPAGGGGAAPAGVWACEPVLVALPAARLWWQVVAASKRRRPPASCPATTTPRCTRPLTHWPHHHAASSRPMCCAAPA